MTFADRIRLAIVVPHTGISGAEMNVGNLLRRLPLERFDIYLFSPAEQLLSQLAQAHGHHVYEYRKSRFFSTSLEIGQRRIFNPVAALYDLSLVLRDAMQLSQFVKQQQIQVIYTGSMMGHLMAYIVRRSNRCARTVIHLQELISSGLGRQIFRIIAQGTDQIVTVSEAAGRVLQSSKPRVLIYNGVDVEEFQTNRASTLRGELNTSAGMPVVGVVGRLTPWKGLTVFLDAVSLLVKRGINSHFVVVGDSVDPVSGPTPYRAVLEAYCDKLGLRERVTFMGYRKDTANVMGGLDALVVPSVRPEPFGLVTVEAMASGKPVVASNTGGLPEIVVDGVTGRLFPPGNPAALAEALYPLMVDSELRSRYGQAGRKRVETHFTLDRFVSGWAEVLVQTAHFE